MKKKGTFLIILNVFRNILKTFLKTLFANWDITAEGDSIQKRINSILRIIFNDSAAILFNWKGQRGVKQKLQGRRISKLMIGKLTLF